MEVIAVSVPAELKERIKAEVRSSWLSMSQWMRCAAESKLNWVPDELPQMAIDAICERRYEEARDVLQRILDAQVAVRMRYAPRAVSVDAARYDAVVSAWNDALSAERARVFLDRTPGVEVVKE